MTSRYKEISSLDSSRISVKLCEYFSSLCMLCVWGGLVHANRGSSHWMILGPLVFRGWQCWVFLVASLLWSMKAWFIQESDRTSESKLACMCAVVSVCCSWTSVRCRCRAALKSLAKSAITQELSMKKQKKQCRVVHIPSFSLRENTVYCGACFISVTIIWALTLSWKTKFTLKLVWSHFKKNLWHVLLMRQFPRVLLEASSGKSTTLCLLSSTNTAARTHTSHLVWRIKGKNLNTWVI